MPRSKAARATGASSYRANATEVHAMSPTRAIPFMVIPTLVILVGAMMTAGCGGRESSPDSRVDEAATADASGDGDHDPCSLLDTREVQAAIGPLVGAPYRVGLDGPQAGGGKCAYQSRDLRTVIIDVTWSDGASVMRMLGLPAAAAGQAGLRGKLPLPDGVTLTGEWDEAKALGCCELTALLGDQAVSIDFLSTRLTTQEGAALLDAALRRLATPLTGVDGNAGVRGALERDQRRAGRPPMVAACALISEAEAAALLGAPVETLPGNGDGKCEYRAKDAPRLLSFTVRWDGGYRQWRSDREIAHQVMGALTGDETPAGAGSADAEYPGPWEMADVIATDFVAVRGDVLMKVDIRGTSLDNGRKALVLAMNHVTWPANPGGK
jgi:hypothetical protein